MGVMPRESRSQMMDRFLRAACSRDETDGETYNNCMVRTTPRRGQRKMPCAALKSLAD